jgi:hypothetical protein
MKAGALLLSARATGLALLVVAGTVQLSDACTSDDASTVISEVDVGVFI